MTGTPCWVVLALSGEHPYPEYLASGLMAVLGRQAILSAIDRGAITITPFDPAKVGPASLISPWPTVSGCSQGS